MRGAHYTQTDFGQDILGSKDFIGGRALGGGILGVSKNPSTAAGSYMHGIGATGNGGYVRGTMGVHNGMQGQDMGYVQANDSFDLDIMMPPDIGSIDSDLSKNII